MCREDRYRLIHILPFLDHGLVACDVDMSSSKPTAVTGMLAIAHARGLFEEVGLPRGSHLRPCMRSESNILQHLAFHLIFCLSPCLAFTSAGCSHLPARALPDP